VFKNYTAKFCDAIRSVTAQQFELRFRSVSRQRQVNVGSRLTVVLQIRSTSVLRTSARSAQKKRKKISSSNQAQRRFNWPARLPHV